MHGHVKRIAGDLTSLVTDVEDDEGRRMVYAIFANLGNVAFIIALLVLVIAFMPQLVMVGPFGVFGAIFGAILIIILAWDTMRKGYARFCYMVTHAPEDEE